MDVKILQKANRELVTTLKKRDKLQQGLAVAEAAVEAARQAVDAVLADGHRKG